ncbi:hypothetical protein [Sphingorhabdus lacus]|uniref:hypothetical protein n=1 Tax=Sphingorhabdus lacus TaxID=392610 RepID=UPI003593272A
MWTHKCKDGRIVELEWSDDDAMEAWTNDVPRKKIGSIEFSFTEGPSGRGDDDYYYVQKMFLEGPDGTGAYIGQGIGRAIIKIVGEMLPIVFSPDDAQRRPDGSHLTGLGSSFARKMVDDRLATFDGDFGRDSDMF